MRKKLTRKKFLHLLGVTTTTLAIPGLSACRGTTVPATETVKSQSSPANKNWNQGSLNHLLSTANHHRFLIKTSFKTPLTAPPTLRVGGKSVIAAMTDTQGRFWSFYVMELEADTVYQLQLFDAKLQPITDAWPLKTFPSPEASPQRLRIMTYTCAGGEEEIIEEDGTAHAIPLAHRHRLLDRGLREKPDLVIANGDHVYWDERTMSKHKPQAMIDAVARAFAKLGTMNRSEPILGHENEKILTRVVDRQIADLYGVRFRSTPVFMVTDDHDLFDNDEAKDEYITLPPDEHMLEAARAVQALYYPEYLPDDTRPEFLPGSGADFRNDDLSETFGTVRYGNLFEALLYDTKRYVSINGEHGTMVPASVETWLAARTASRATLHLAHVPSTPIAWSAGKWGEWYPDVLNEATGKLSLEKEKRHWPSGWWSQHQRILGMLNAQKDRVPLILSGDLHMSSAAKIISSGELDLSASPIYSIVVGALGTGTGAYASRARGVLPQLPVQIQAEEFVKPTEKNGFTIVDITPETMDFQMYTWRSPEPVDAIDSLKPSATFSLARTL